MFFRSINTPERNQASLLDIIKCNFNKFMVFNHKATVHFRKDETFSIENQNVQCIFSTQNKRKEIYGAKVDYLTFGVSPCFNL